ncbi:MAG: T9SS type A sorting domain-containing protein [Cyclobacteriaceae bacterium]|nr:T9SS type A sorting domain-containing protein [Cyclobacteriaceae bacterium]
MSKIFYTIAFLTCWTNLAYAQPPRPVTFTSSNLPIIVINTSNQEILDEPKITADMGIIYNGVGVRNNVNDPFNNFSGKIGIERRGSTSQTLFPKKQYGIELRDNAGEGIDAPLLGLPKKDDWVLFAPYNDKSLMRDVLAYKLGRDMGDYASRSRYCELVLNNVYQGVYVLLEKVKRDKNRVNIDKLDPAEISGDNLTGGYIVKIDKTTGSGGDGWSSTFPPIHRSGNQTTFFQYDYPKQEDIAPEQKAYIKNYFASFETALAGENFKDPANGYRKYIDVNSFVDYFIANELSRNPDAYRLSTYLHKKKDSDGGKIFMGPIWDFNLGFGNVDFCIKGGTEGFVIDYNYTCPTDGWLTPFWWNRLFKDEAFKAQVVARWSDLRAGPFQTSKVMTYIDSVATVLNVESQQRNFQAWPVLGAYVWPNSFVGNTYQSEVNFLKDWTTKRLQWLDASIPGITTGVEEFNTSKSLRVAAFPNPFSSQLQVEYELSVAGTVGAEILDLAGRKLYEESQFREEGKHQVTFSQTHLPSGIYFLKVKFGQEVQVIKVLRQ